MSSVSKPRVRHNRHKQGLNQTLEKISADFRLTKIVIKTESLHNKNGKILYGESSDLQICNNPDLICSSDPAGIILLPIFKTSIIQSLSFRKIYSRISSFVTLYFGCNVAKLSSAMNCPPSSIAMIFLVESR